jgi:hypothetical protein
MIGQRRGVTDEDVGHRYPGDDLLLAPVLPSALRRAASTISETLSGSSTHGVGCHQNLIKAVTA